MPNTPDNDKSALTAQLSLAGLTLVLLVIVVLLVVRTLQLDHQVHVSYEQALRLAQLSFEVQHDVGRLRLLRLDRARLATQRRTTLQEIDGALRARLGEIGALELTAAERNHFDALAAAVTAATTASRAALAGTPGPNPGQSATLPPDTSAAVQFEQIDRALAGLVTAVHARTEATAASAHNVTEFIRYALAGAAALMLLLAATLAALLVRTLNAHRRRLGLLDQLAREDGLTGVLNRRALDESLPVELARAQRLGYALSVAMLDLDHFKRYNDKRGHGAGDVLLRTAAQGWRRQLRPTDLLARYGGEEFTLVLPACDAAQAVMLVERLRPTMPERQTFSAGVAEWNRHDNLDDLLRAADLALLTAKRSGRNRTVVGEPEKQVALPLKLVSDG